MSRSETNVSSYERRNKNILPIYKVRRGFVRAFIDRTGTPGDLQKVPNLTILLKEEFMYWFYQILIGVGLLFIGFAVYQVVSVGSMSDEDREKWGHGPKGQGR